MENVKRLVLIDGHAILHRAYHALPAVFKNKTGQPTNAVYGFTTILLKLLKDLQPTYLAVAFDRPEPNFRQKIYTPYQAKRPEMESNLQEQIPLVHELLGALKISYYEVAGYEADDILGSLAAQACSAWRVARSKNGETTSHKPQATSSVEVIIVSGDRDMFQLINENTKVCVPVKGLSETKIYDEAAVRAEYRVAPCQWVDVKALRGDPSDNYPGVQGIGPKTAAELIAKYGTLENLYDRLGDLGKLGVRLAEGAESAGLSKKLAAIKTDVPVQLDLERAAIMGINWHLGIGYMREKLGFRSIAERIENKTSNPVTQLPNKNKDSKISNKNEQLGLI